MGKCTFCGKEHKLISQILEICRGCILNQDWDAVKTHIMSVHSKIRQLEDLPEKPPKALNSKIELQCNLCINECILTENDISYCGLRNVKKHKSGELPFPTNTIGYIHGYTDPNPTNCCNSWFCPAGTPRGYPKYSNYDKPEYGTLSYALFFYGCTFDCLFCQNWSHKSFSKRALMDAENLATQIVKNEHITCLCYFGGTPESQLPFSIHLAELILEKLEKINNNRKLRICWEWNGSGREDLVEKCMKIAIKTGGNIKFDLKSFNEKLNLALCGVSNKRTLENFQFLGKKYFGTRGEDMPEISACTLLVPGYVERHEVEQIAKFIDSINKDIPYSLLIFHGEYQMKDLSITPKDQVYACLDAAKNYLRNVHLGNKFLLQYV